MQRFDAQGTYQLGWGSAGTGKGQFTRITDLEVGPSGRVYVMEDRPDHQGRVQVFDPDGTFRASFGRGLFVDTGGTRRRRGRPHLRDRLRNERRSRSSIAGGKLLRTFGEGAGIETALGAAIDGNTLYVASQDNTRIVRFDLSTGLATGYFPTDGIASGIAVDPAGAVLAISGPDGAAHPLRGRLTGEGG